MRILILVEVYPPSRGGIETVTQAVARAWAAAGHQVDVVTPAADGEGVDAADAGRGVHLHRLSGWFTRLRLWARADVVLHSHFSLRGAGILAALPGRSLVWLHTYLPAAGLQARVKRCLLRLHRVVCISDAVAAGLPPSRRRPPCFRDDVFIPDPAAIRDRDLVFVGRLVSDKGCDVALDALAILAGRGLRPSLRVIGGGPEEVSLRAQAARLGIADQIDWSGPQPAERVAAELNRHRVLVAPSRWNEPFGVVALEALACGCVPLVTSGGGMAEAVGRCGLALPNGDAGALAEAIAEVLTDADRRAHLLAGAMEHLARFRPAAVAEDLLRFIQS